MPWILHRETGGSALELTAKDANRAHVAERIYGQLLPCELDRNHVSQ